MIWYLAGFDPTKVEAVRELSMWDVVAGVEKLLRQAILSTPHKA